MKSAPKSTLKSSVRFVVPLAVVLATMGVASAPASADSDRPAERPVIAAAAAPAVVGIKGGGRMAYPVPEDEIRIFVNARGTVPARDGARAGAGTAAGAGAASGATAGAKAWGTFRIQHLVPQPDGRPPLFNWGNFKVDCLRVDGSEVTVTGRIVEAGPYWQEFLERKPTARMGLSFHIPKRGEGPSRVAITPPAAADRPEVPKCAVKAPDADVIEGGYRVMDGRR
ncbi:hypothetical protein ACWEV4_10255 [Streptomyces sp. NPDC003860]